MAKIVKVDGVTATIVAELRAMGSEENGAGMARFGIRPANGLGISMTALRTVARRYNRSHDLAADLWATGIHEARLLATLLDEPALVSKIQMDHWAHDFDTWDICDQACANLFDKTPHVDEMSAKWVRSPHEYVKRTGFVLMATSAIHDRSADDQRFLDFLPVLRNGMTDERNFVKKAVSWSFRQIGKRNRVLQLAVLETVEPLRDDSNRTVRWIARDVFRELQSDSVITRLKERD